MRDIGAGRVTDEVDLDQRVLDEKTGGPDRRARRRCLEISRQTSSKAAKLLRSVRNTWAFTT